MADTRRLIALFGSYLPEAGQAVYQLACDIGLQLAQAGFDLINGGHDGTMAASAKGAKDGGANVIGVTCADVRRARETDVNPYADEVIEASSLLERIDIMMRCAGGYVVMEGGTGTLAELAVVWEHVCKGIISPRPIVIVGSSWDGLIETIASRYPASIDCIHRVDTVDEAVRVMLDRSVDVSEADRTLHRLRKT